MGQGSLFDHSPLKLSNTRNHVIRNRAWIGFRPGEYFLFELRRTCEALNRRSSIEERKHDDDQQEESQASARVISPPATVRPSWHRRKEENQQNQQQQHGYTSTVSKANWDPLFDLHPSVRRLQDESAER